MKNLYLLFISLFLFGGCISKPEPILRLALVEWIGYAPLYVAEAKGWLPKNIRIIDFTSNYEIVDAMKMGNIEIAALTLDEIITLHTSSSDFKIVCFLDRSNGADTLLTVPDIQTLDVLVTREHTFKEAPHTIDALIHAWIRGVNALKNDPDSIDIVADYLHTTPVDVKSALKDIKLLDCNENLAYINEKEARFRSIVSTLATILKERGSIEHTPDAHTLIDARWLMHACSHQNGI